MNVLVITNMYPSKSRPYSGIFVKEQVDELLKQGINIDLLFIDTTNGKQSYFTSIFEMWKRIRKNKYDLIHAHYVHSGWIARLQFKLPVVVTSHGSDTLGHEGWFLKKLYPWVNAVTITSKQNQMRIGLPDTYILPCGVDTTVFKYSDKDTARKELGWDVSKKIMLYVGRNSPLKRLDILQDCHNIISNEIDNTELILATNVEHDKMPLYMSAADVFVFASETEGSPVVIKEAIACDLPIVSVDVGDVPEMIDNIENCYICERTPESMAYFVTRIFENCPRSNGHDFLERISNENIAKRLIDIYENVL